MASGLRRWLDAVSSAIERIRDIEEIFRFCTFRFGRPVSGDQPGGCGYAREVLAEGMNQGRFRSVDPDLTTEMLYAIYVMYIIRINIRSDGREVRELFEQTVDVVLYGLVKK